MRPSADLDRCRADDAASGSPPEAAATSSSHERRYTYPHVGPRHRRSRFVTLAPVADTLSTRSTREAILVEARRCFADHGYDGTSLNDIAEAVGIRRPSLLHHFPSKEALYREVFETALAEWYRAGRGGGVGHRPTRAGTRSTTSSPPASSSSRRTPSSCASIRREALEVDHHLGIDLGEALRPQFHRAVGLLRAGDGRRPVPPPRSRAAHAHRLRRAAQLLQRRARPRGPARPRPARPRPSTPASSTSASSSAPPSNPASRRTPNPR